MAKAKENLLRLKCVECGQKNYYTTKNKRKVERKIEMKKFCRWCKKHTIHKEVKITGK